MWDLHSATATPFCSLLVARYLAEFFIRDGVFRGSEVDAEPKVSDPWSQSPRKLHNYQIKSSYGT